MILSVKHSGFAFELSLGKSDGFKISLILPVSLDARSRRGTLKFSSSQLEVTICIEFIPCHLAIPFAEQTQHL
jgi:hypothetical protein